MLNSSLGSLLEIVVQCGRWLFDRFAARGFVVSLRILRNSTHRIKRRIQRLQRRRQDTVEGSRKHSRLNRRIAVHKWRLSARRLAVRWLENYAAEYEAEHIVGFIGDRLAIAVSILDGLTAPYGAAYPWETRGAAA